MSHETNRHPVSAGSDWSTVEVEAAVRDYLDMLTKELRGDHFNKAAHNRQLRQLLAGRSKSSVEMKHQNISAVLIELGYPSISGYKPLPNFQRTVLPRIVEEHLRNSPTLQRLVAALVSAPANDSVTTKSVLPKRVRVPDSPSPRTTPHRRAPTKTPKLPRDYLEIEARNRSLGRAGEEMVIRFEYQRLRAAGKQRLAKRIDHVAVSIGDGLGYDILSFETNGRERLIEVKTTRFGPFTPFYASRNEVDFSDEQPEVFHLYRLFKFSDSPRLFVMHGSLRHTCRLEAAQFSGIPK